MTRLAAVTFVCVLLVACGGHSAGRPTAAAFLRQVTTEFSRGQAGRLWDDLVPAEQAVVSRSAYVSCARNGFRMKQFKVLDEYREPVSVLSRQMDATAVTVQVTSDDGVTTATMHAVQVGGRWRWILARADLAAFRSGRCP